MSDRPTEEPFVDPGADPEDSETDIGTPVLDDDPILGDLVDPVEDDLEIDDSSVPDPEDEFMDDDELEYTEDEV